MAERLKPRSKAEEAPKRPVIPERPLRTTSGYSAKRYKAFEGSDWSVYYRVSEGGGETEVRRYYLGKIQVGFAVFEKDKIRSYLLGADAPHAPEVFHDEKALHKFLKGLICE